MGEKRESDQEPGKPGRPEQRTSLAPLEFEDALRDLMATGKPDDDSDSAPERSPQRESE